MPPIAIPLLCIAVIPALFGVPGGAFAAEIDHRRQLCAGMAQEVPLGPQRRVDCLSATHAIEVEWDDKWQEAIGQALSYAAEAGVRPGVVLICRRDPGKCLQASLNVQQTFGVHGLGGTLWECLPTDASLAACRRIEMGGE